MRSHSGVYVIPRTRQASRVTHERPPPTRFAPGARTRQSSVVRRVGSGSSQVPYPWVEGLDLLTSDDAQLALACCYELHCQSFQGVDELGPPQSIEDSDVLPILNELTTRDGGVSLSRYMLEDGTIEEFREFCVHRSEYQRKEADPIPG